MIKAKNDAVLGYNLKIVIQGGGGGELTFCGG